MGVLNKVTLNSSRRDCWHTARAFTDAETRTLERSLSDLDRQILQYNLYGVDLNAEATRRRFPLVSLKRQSIRDSGKDEGCM